MYGIQGLWTAARYHIPVTFVVANNAQYKILKTSVGVMGLTHVPQAGYGGMDLDNPAVDIEGMARSLGVEALCVTEPDEAGRGRRRLVWPERAAAVGSADRAVDLDLGCARDPIGSMLSPSTCASERRLTIPSISGRSQQQEEMRSMTVTQQDRRIAWYRSPVDREVLASLNQRNDWKGLMQTLGHLGLLALTGAAAFYAAGRFPLAVLLLILFLHGTFWAFLLNGFHELCHKTVFKTKALNTIFLYAVSFLSWYNPVMFWASHQEHHKFTLHPPDDLEVVLPIKLTRAGPFSRTPW